MNSTEDILELNKRIIDLNKQRTIDAYGQPVVQKFDVRVAPVWFQQAGVESFNKRDPCTTPTTTFTKRSS